MIIISDYLLVFSTHFIDIFGQLPIFFTYRNVSFVEKAYICTEFNRSGKCPAQ